MTRRHWTFFSYQVMLTRQGGDAKELKGANDIQVQLAFEQRSGEHSHMSAPLVKETRNVWSKSKQRHLHKRRSLLCAHQHHARGCDHCTHPLHCRDTAYLVCPTSFSQAARVECLLTGHPRAFPLRGGPGTSYRGQKSFSKLSNPFLTAGQQRGRLPEPGDWGFSQALVNAENGSGQRATQRCLPASGGLKAAPLLLCGRPREDSSLQGAVRTPDSVLSLRSP